MGVISCTARTSVAEVSARSARDSVAKAFGGNLRHMTQVADGVDYWVSEV